MTELYLINQFPVNESKKDGFSTIITLLDYETQISKALRYIKLSSEQINNTKKVLIDTVLCAGMNQYRFIETNVNEDRTINIDNYKYIAVSDDALEKANNILKSHPEYVKNSILTESQIKKLLQN